jgi:Reverse transcriptase (RNA-dependent DNA polymerase)
MTLPPSHKKNYNSMCRLNKLIYGLKQSLRTWYEKLSFYLILCNFKVSSVDNFLFVKHNHEHTTIVLVYMDDIIITSNNKIQIKDQLN